MAGSEFGGRNLMAGTPVNIRLARYTEKTSQCWLWRGSLSPDGYGRIAVQGRNVGAHRVAWELVNGPIPTGLTIDHLCRVRACVNPTHLEAVPLRENVLRGLGPTAINSSKTHCVHGHEFNEANTYVYPSGYRHCRVCRRALDRVRVRQH